MKILLFEPWHLGDVAVALSVTNQFVQPGVEFALVANSKWREWALDTGIVKKVFSFNPPWTARKQKDKYNPFHYNFSDFARLRKEILLYNPDVIVELRGDIRAKWFLKLLVGNKIRIVSSELPVQENVYNRGETIKKVLTAESVNKKQPRDNNGKICVFFGASDFNREVPEPVAINLLCRLKEEGYSFNWILQPTDDGNRIQKLLNEHSLHDVNLLQESVTGIAQHIKNSSLVISCDSGWLHIAHFYNRPAIGLFGFDTMKTWLPPGSFYVTSANLYPDHFRYKKQYGRLQPLQQLPVDNIIKLVRQIHTQKVIS